MEANLEPVLPSIRARTLIVHRVDTGLFDMESVREFVKLIPDAKSAELPGRDELPYVGDADDLLDVIEEFLTGAQPAQDFDRSLATVLFTDIVGSTQKASGRRGAGHQHHADAGTRLGDQLRRPWPAQS
jgi:hypothetical protein